jgi:UDP-glucose 4-epimerase
MNIFITGTESFVGKEVIQQCDAKGYNVSGVDSISPKDKRFKAFDIRNPEIDNLIPDNTDTIIHLAALSRDPDCKDKAYECFDINVMGTLNLINAAKKKNVKQFIFASSEWVYDNCTKEDLKTEDSVIKIQDHTSEYALSKLVSENNLRQKFSHGMSDVTILRFGIIYGPRKNNWSAVESLFNQVATQPELKVGSLATARCFIHVNDIARGIVSSVGLKGLNTINLQGSKLLSLKEVIETSKVVLGKNPNVIETNPINASIRNISNEKAKRLINFEAKYDITAGLKSLLGNI